MAIEIERRFIVRSNNWKVNVKSSQELQQGYLASDSQGWTTRIRIEDQNRALLTLKKQSSMISNYEYEYKIPIEEGVEILEMTSTKIYKTRYSLNIEQKEWIVDCFHGKNHPLIIAEVEMRSEQDKINKPQWCNEEITGQYQWSNASLAKIPIAIWSIKNRLSGERP